MSLRTSLSCITLFLVLAVVGCGEKGPGLIPVTGKVTYGGGDWPKAGNINFNPVEPVEGYPRLNGTAEFQPDGTFTVRSSGDKFGLVPGKYSINIECWEVPPSMDASQTPKSYLPDGYQPPQVEIAVGDSKKEVTFDVPKKG